MLIFRYGEFVIPFSKRLNCHSTWKFTCVHVKVWVLLAPPPCPLARDVTDSDPDKPDFPPLAVRQPAVEWTKPLTSVSHCAGRLAWLLFSLCELRQEDKLLNNRDNMLYTQDYNLGFGPKVGLIVPKWDKSGTFFRIDFSTFWHIKTVLKFDLKKIFETNLTNFGP